MNRHTLYKKFFKLGSHIDNICFHYIQYDLVENATHDLWKIIKNNDPDVIGKFAYEFYQIKRVLEKRILYYSKIIKSTEFKKDTKLLVQISICKKLEDLKTTLLKLNKFEGEFISTVEVSLLSIENYNK